MTAVERLSTGTVTSSGPAGPEDLVAHVTRVSERLLGLDGPMSADEAVEDTRRYARALGLPADGLARRLHHGLAQGDSLGPDEIAEYRRNMRALLVSTGVADPLRPTPRELFAAFLRTGREVVAALAAAVPARTDRTVVFLGTDAEYLKPAYDLLTGDPAGSEVFYLSRLSLLSDAERAVLSRTSRAVFGPQEVTRKGSPGRYRAWMDNGLVPSQMFRLVSAARAEAEAEEGPDGRPFDELFLERFADEVVYGTDQGMRRDRGPLTMFGSAVPETDAVLLEGIDSGLFSRRCLAAGRQLLAGAARPAGRGLTLVDLGAGGTQPALLMGAARVLAPAADVSVTLFTPHPGRWGRPGRLFRPAPLTSLFALGVETVKSFATDYQGAARGAAHTIVAVEPDQLLLAHLKHLAFHRAVFEVREEESVPSGG
ncbi:hypothetical protein [Streptomyces sp. NPDC047841]|uniref:hypothetical protein n=1 Tax=Streptomyces sp. NPDC047841 TaxID=3154708 RepID=UPI0034552659